MPLGGDVTCTIVNTDDTPTLTLVKTVTNDDGGTKRSPTTPDGDRHERELPGTAPTSVTRPLGTFRSVFGRGQLRPGRGPEPGRRLLEHR